MRILVTVTNTGWLHRGTVEALLRLLLDGRYKLTIRLPKRPPPYENNLNHIAKEVVDEGFDFWLQMDSDNFPMNNPLDLVSLDKDIVIMPYPQWHVTDETVDKGESPTYWLAMDAKEGGFKQHTEMRGLQKIDAGGSGGMLIARRVLEKMKHPFSRTYDEDGRVDIGVDFNFCTKAKKEGFEIYAHYDYPQFHLKEIELTEVQKAMGAFYERRYAKKESSGKELVFYCGSTREYWDGDTPQERGIAGSEEAIIYLAPELVKLGWDVTVYNQCKEEKVINGVKWSPHTNWNRFDKRDVTVIWRKVKNARQYINSDKVVMDIHDVGKPDQFKGLKLDKIFVKSEYHKSLFDTDIPMAVVPNGIITFGYKVKRDPHLIVNTSSPDRGLGTLVKAFLKVKERVPEAKLAWAYGWSWWDKAYGGDPQLVEWKKAVLKAMEKHGIENLGRITHKEIDRLLKKARVFAYPTTYPEIFCISAVKAQIAGAVPVTTDVGALDEVVTTGYKVKAGERDEQDWGIINTDEWVDKVVEVLQSDEQIEYDGSKFLWPNVAKMWDKELWQ